MDGSITVPIIWMFVILGTLISAFTWWLRAEWNRNWKEHDVMRHAAETAHLELDRRIDKHHGTIDSHLDRIHSRIDWLISHNGGPAYPDDDNKR